MYVIFDVLILSPIHVQKPPSRRQILKLPAKAKTNECSPSALIKHFCLSG